ncbi:MAG: hypothetical protein CMO82_11210 [Winogradskyella sp.]|nr:hypothetical protein [Winogradskyella sp.]
MKENKKIPKVMHSNSLTVDGDEHTESLEKEHIDYMNEMTKCCGRYRWACRCTKKRRDACL